MKIDLAKFLYNINACPTLFNWPIRFILYIISVCYGLVTIIRNKGFDWGLIESFKLDVPVISIGNITTGGTGKTPAAIYLVKSMQKLYKRKLILISRGYGGDECKLFAQSLPDTPHFINSKRVIAGRQAIANHGKDICLVLDDGFQHRYLQRDLNIVLIDCTVPFGFGYTLPRGFLREPLQGLKRADLVILTRCAMVDDARIDQIKQNISCYCDVPCLRSEHAAVKFQRLNEDKCHSLDWIQNRKVFVFAGIGNPLSFISSLEKCQPQIMGQQFFPDHFSYSQDDLDYLVGKAQQSGASDLITTAKDAVKLKNLAVSIPVWILDIEFCVDNEGIWQSMVSQIM